MLYRATHGVPRLSQLLAQLSCCAYMITFRRPFTNLLMEIVGWCTPPALKSDWDQDRQMMYPLSHPRKIQVWLRLLSNVHPHGLRLLADVTPTPKFHESFRTGLIFLTWSKWIQEVLCYHQNSKLDQNRWVMYRFPHTTHIQDGSTLQICHWGCPPEKFKMEVKIWLRLKWI